MKNNTFSSTQIVSGFANSIMAEYCPSGVFNIVDNTISNSLTGITSIQSSPYIARNTINGVSESGKGIYLDNSNGTIKYNTVNNHINSLTAFYSSPFLLKNQLLNASERNIDIYTSSVPVMHPVTSENTLRWFAGNNTISGYPSADGMSFTSDAYPDMAEGYNNFNTNGVDYISGIIPSSLGILNVTGNWWGERPESQKFNVQNGTVVYEPTYQGAPPAPDYYELTDIGFGLYDTVYVKNLGDSPGAEDLFMQAVIKENLKQYTNAINLYKQIITNFRNSRYAVISLSRIFNCYEKKLSNIGEYQIFQNYIQQIRTNNQLSLTLRETAEDFIIKTKVRMGLLQNAVNDYQQMYQLNQNNPKGIHALLNKEVLLNMIHDTSDNMGMNSLAEHKLKVISMVSGKDLNSFKTHAESNPVEFKLYQNYPNPFNPQTTIKYDIPKEGFVSIVLYDILGKVIYSNSVYRKAGSYKYTFDGSNLASGLYFYKITAGSYVQTKKMVLIK